MCFSHRRGHANNKSIDQIEVDDILSRHLISRMNEGIEALRPHVNEWMNVGVIAEVDWNRVRSLDFQDLLRSRNSLAKHLRGKECLKCPEIDKHVRVSSSWMIHADFHICSTKSFTEKKFCAPVLQTLKMQSQIRIWNLFRIMSNA